MGPGLSSAGVRAGVEAKTDGAPACRSIFSAADRVLDIRVRAILNSVNLGEADKAFKETMWLTSERRS